MIDVMTFLSVANLCHTRTEGGKYTKHDINGVLMVQSCCGLFEGRSGRQQGRKKTQKDSSLIQN